MVKSTRKQPKETLIPHEVPDQLWAKVGVDLLTYRGRNYLICVDYYSSFWEIVAVCKAWNPGDVCTVLSSPKLNLRNSAVSGTCACYEFSNVTAKQWKGRDGC